MSAERPDSLSFTARAVLYGSPLIIGIGFLYSRSLPADADPISTDASHEEGGHGLVGIEVGRMHVDDGHDGGHGLGIAQIGEGCLVLFDGEPGEDAVVVSGRVCPEPFDLRLPAHITRLMGSEIEIQKVDTGKEDKGSH